MFYSLGRVNNACLFPWRLNPPAPRAPACPGLPTFVLSCLTPGSESAQSPDQQYNTITISIVIITQHLLSQTLCPSLSPHGVMATRTANPPMLQMRRLRLRMEDTLLQGHTGAAVEPGFILGVTDTKAQVIGHLSPLLRQPRAPWEPTCKLGPRGEQHSSSQGHTAPAESARFPPCALSCLFGPPKLQRGQCFPSLYRWGF